MDDKLQALNTTQSAIFNSPQNLSEAESEHSIRAHRSQKKPSLQILPNTAKQPTSFERWKNMLSQRLSGRFISESSDQVASYSARYGDEAAEIIAKNAAKTAPILGAIPSLIAAKDMLSIAINSPIPEARYLAKIAMKLNAGDAALSIVEPFIAGAGLPVAADLALGSAELWLDLTINDIQKQPNFRASDELKTIIGLIALRDPINAFPELSRDFGLEGARDILITTASTISDKANSSARELYHFITE